MAASEEGRNDPVTLAPLEFESALRALLAVDPESEPEEDEKGD